MSDDLWAKITALPRPHRIVDFPRKTEDGEAICQVAIWVLSQEEQMAAASASEVLTRKLLGKDVPRHEDAREGYHDVYQNAASIEVLFRACRHPEDLKRPFFPSPAQMRSALSIDEIGVLMNHYFSVQAEVGPIISRMTPEEVDAFVDALIRSGDRFPLDSLSPGQLRALVVSMAARMRSSSTDTSSPGSQPEEQPIVTGNDSG